MKILLLSIVSIMLYSTCAQTAAPDSIRLGINYDSEANLYAREGLFDVEENPLNKRQTAPSDDESSDHKAKASIISDCVTFGGNALTYLCSPRVLCAAIFCALTVYYISIPFIYGMEYCHQTFAGVDNHCINLDCLKKRNLLENYSLCQKNRICWREHHKVYDVCLSDECAYAENYCNDTMAVALALVILPFVFCLRSCMYHTPHASKD